MVRGRKVDRCELWGGRTVVVKPEENGEQQGKGDGEEHVADRNIPEVDEPAAVGCGLEGGAGR